MAKRADWFCRAKERVRYAMCGISFAWLTLIHVDALAAPITITAFGIQIAQPSTMPVGTVMARYFIPPTLACGAPTCPLGTIGLWPRGGGMTVPGPVIETNVAGVSTRVLINGQVVSGGAQPAGTVITQPIEVQLIRNSAQMQKGSLMSSKAPGYFSLCESTMPGNGVPGTVIGPGYNCNLGKQFLTIELRGTITPIAGTCQTPSQVISLPPATTHVFQGVGSTNGQTRFQLRFDNCPAGFNQISYILDPLGSAVPGSPGVLAPAADSTATGIVFRVTDVQGTPVAFNQLTTLSSYSSVIGGSYSVPLNVSYFQTLPTVSVGSLNSRMQVLVDYQ